MHPARDRAVARLTMNDDPIAGLVMRLADALRARRWHLATAESCTGGMIAAACTDLAGSSDWFERAVAAHPEDPAILAQLADTQLKLGRTDAARSNVERGLKIDPTDRQLLALARKLS